MVFNDVSFFSFLKFIYRYGFSMQSLKSLCNTVLENVKKIYGIIDLNSEQKAFENM